MKNRKVILNIALVFSLGVGGVLFTSCESDQNVSNDANNSPTTPVMGGTSDTLHNQIRDTVNYDGTPQPAGTLKRNDTIK